MSRRPTTTALFPYTTLFRSRGGDGTERPALGDHALGATHRVLVELRWPEVPMDGALRRESRGLQRGRDRKSTRLNSSHGYNSYAVFCLKKKIKEIKSNYE